MAFTAAVLGITVFGNKMVAYGTYVSSSGGIGGDINTSLAKVESMVLQPKGSSVATNYSVINETFPVAGNAVTIVTDADQSGYWLAFGY